MIETKFYLLTEKDHLQFTLEAQCVGVDIDYYLMEFCSVNGTTVRKDGDNWIEVE